MSGASSSFAALGTTAVVVVGEPAALATARRLLEDELAAFDAACSRFRPDSELSELNCHAGEPVAVGPLLFDAVALALRIAARTRGLVDPTVGASLRLAGYDRTFADVRLRDGTRFTPSWTKVAGWQSVSLDQRTRTIRVPRGVELDLGATAKALAADRAANAAAAATGTSVLVGLGGDIAVAGSPPSAGWPVRIEDDHAASLDGCGPVVAVAAGGLATSGTRVRRWTTTGGELHHIVDPRTGKPAATPWRTVSVAAQSCVDANAATTAAIVLGCDAPGWLARERLPARLVYGSGEVVALNGWPEDPA
jgi:thiamine biosynthesis lipoprotein